MQSYTDFLHLKIRLCYCQLRSFPCLLLIHWYRPNFAWETGVMEGIRKSLLVDFLSTAFVEIITLPQNLTLLTDCSVVFRLAHVSPLAYPS